MVTGRALDHIGLACSDVEANAKWYMDVLGFQLKARFQGPRPHPVYFLYNPSKDVVYEMYQKDNLLDCQKGKIDHVALVSNDIEADFEFCKKAGYTIDTDNEGAVIKDIPDRWENGCRYFKIVSPCGEYIEFSQNL